MADQTLYFLIKPLCAKLLRNSDTLDSTSCYCEISIGRQARVSKNAEIALKFPSWNDELPFLIRSEDKISVKVWDIKPDTRKVIFGEATILREDITDLYENWVILAKGKENVGEMKLKIEISHECPEKYSNLEAEESKQTQEIPSQMINYGTQQETQIEHTYIRSQASSDIKPVYYQMASAPPLPSEDFHEFAPSQNYSYSSLLDFDAPQPVSQTYNLPQQKFNQNSAFQFNSQSSYPTLGGVSQTNSQTSYPNTGYNTPYFPNQSKYPSQSSSQTNQQYPGF
ncbi:unnamed protein product [Blepharisma stoltei]|uniref:C2 domain-containing protein n=1 Tax=Blepharisma stoltei TaxID=1481888 RepID=A0AAU9JF09_9CILI|nr:unnamed protein product [Blepharisma stoltei]